MLSKIQGQSQRYRFSWRMFWEISLHNNCVLFTFCWNCHIWEWLAWQWDVNETGKWSTPLRRTRCKQWSRRNRITSGCNESLKSPCYVSLWIRRKLEAYDVTNFFLHCTSLLTVYTSHFFFVSFFFTFLFLQPPVAQFSNCNPFSCFTFVFPSFFFKLPQAVAQLSLRKKNAPFFQRVWLTAPLAHSAFCRMCVFVWGCVCLGINRCLLEV